MYESEFRAYTKANGGPSWETTTTEVLEALGADVVLEGAQATGGTVYQYSQASGVEQIDGKWYTKHILGPVFVDTPATEYTNHSLDPAFADIPVTETTPAKTAAENEAKYKASKDAEQAKFMRQTRDDKLKECDWVVIKNLETNSNIPGAWEVYRQALRDVPTQSGFPWTITWPDAP